ncbi:uncharacterized protein LOC114075228 [Solanum pennellii]|uniref:Uncharacterized protein LOC114075228 n=1 Tax=Solanum pennellii TaxID=28526 RepID=A0ABM1V110_SOLPN|nr:uncharacterized protein LOC114075228 [Solanum pennellii]
MRQAAAPFPLFSDLSSLLFSMFFSFSLFAEPPGSRLRRRTVTGSSDPTPVTTTRRCLISISGEHLRKPAPTSTNSTLLLFSNQDEQHTPASISRSLPLFVDEKDERGRNR